MSSSVFIYPATMLDASNIYRLCLEMWRLSKVDLHPPSEPRAFNMICTAIANELAWVALKDNRIIGSIGAVPYKFWWSDEVFIQELWWYVRPGMRKATTAATELFDVLQTAAQLRNADLVMQSISQVGRDAAFERLMESKYQMKKTGTIFVGSYKKDVLK